jgi:hypothetical protein
MRTSSSVHCHSAHTLSILPPGPHTISPKPLICPPDSIGDMVGATLGVSLGVSDGAPLGTWVGALVGGGPEALHCQRHGTALSETQQ